jgi:Mg2+ and Co2+ transporter CorA
MAEKTAVDPYIKDIQAQIDEINRAIKASNQKQFDKIAELEQHKAHYLKFQKGRANPK